MLFEKRQADEKKTKRYVARFDFGFGMCFRGIGYAGLVRFKLSFMPLVSADSKGGVIITDWKSMQGAANEQFKVTVTIHTRELRADGLKAEVFERELSNGVWVDKKANPKLADELEKAILYRARDLFRRDVISR